MPINWDLTQVGAVLDRIGLEWLEITHPELAMAIDEAVGRGVTPERIRRFVLAQVGRVELALRCEQAARHLSRDQ
jgi:hypothetical protein